MVMRVYKPTNRRARTGPSVEIDRRKAHRFDLTWLAVVKGVGEYGQPFQEFSTLRNLSSTGACLSLTISLPVGIRVELDVRSPLSQKQWLRYFGRVIYAECQPEQQIIGIRFESAKPTFIPAAAVIRLHTTPARSSVVH